MPGTVIAVPHRVVRWSIDTQASFEDFRARYESAVPESSMPTVSRSFEPTERAGTTCCGRRRRTRPTASCGSGARMSAARCSWPATADDSASYLMGNHTIAERMYRHDPAVMLYAPLRSDHPHR